MGPGRVVVALGALAAQGAQEVIDRAGVIAALLAYRSRLKAQGKLLKAAAVEHCIAIVRQL